MTDFDWYNQKEYSFTKAPMCRVSKCAARLCVYNAGGKCTLPEVEINSKGSCESFRDEGERALGSLNQAGRTPKMDLPNPLKNVQDHLKRR